MHVLEVLIVWCSSVVVLSGSKTEGPASDPQCPVTSNLTKTGIVANQ